MLLPCDKLFDHQAVTLPFLNLKEPVMLHTCKTCDYLPINNPSALFTSIFHFIEICTLRHQWVNLRPASVSINEC